MSEKLTVAEYAQRTGKTKQSIYKRIKKGTLKSVEEVVNGKTTAFVLIADNPQEVELNPDFNPELNQDEVENNPELNPKEVELNQEEQPNFNPELNPQNTADANLRIIEILNEQLKEKDKQIEKLQEQNERLTALALRAQELEARTQALLGQPEQKDEPIETDTEEQKPEETPEQESTITEETEQPKKKRFLRWLFGE